jgi:hypothetical protein
MSSALGFAGVTYLTWWQCGITYGCGRLFPFASIAECQGPTLGASLLLLELSGTVCGQSWLASSQ